MDTPAPCAQWPTACLTSPAPCSATAPASTRTVQDMSQRERATHALDRHSPRLPESDDETARGRCGHVVCGVSKSRWARLCVHGDGPRPWAIPSPHARLHRRHDDAKRHLQNGGESFSACRYHRRQLAAQAKTPDSRRPSLSGPRARTGSLPAGINTDGSDPPGGGGGSDTVPDTWADTAPFAEPRQRQKSGGRSRPLRFGWSVTSRPEHDENHIQTQGKHGYGCLTPTRRFS